MKVQPRQQLLEIWEALIRSSWRDDRWVPGGRHGSNPISDAEQLLCLLLPATRMQTFVLDIPEQTSDRMAEALRPLGTASDIPRVITRMLADYFTRYLDAAGAPIFSGDGYYAAVDAGREPTERQRELPVVESFAVSVTLSLATLGFVRVFRREVSRRVTREDVRVQLQNLEALAGVRLTAALVGLLRSFSVNVFSVDSVEGESILGLLNQAGMPRRTVLSRLQRRLRETAAGLRDILIGSGQIDDLEQSDRLFECGWSWSIVRDAPAIETSARIGPQPPGTAVNAPYLYFTGMVMDAIEDLFSERTRILGLLDGEQQRLARALQLRWELTRTYWATVATFGEAERWALEGNAWRTTDGAESDYFTLQVASLTVKGLRARGSGAQFARVGAVLAALAERGRITSRTVAEDPSLRLHHPGVQIELYDSRLADGDPMLAWPVPDFSTQLLTQTAGVAALLSDAGVRGGLLDLSDEVWTHLYARRVDRGRCAGLWDQPSRLYPGLPESGTEPSWYFTVRVVTALMTVAQAIDQWPTRSEDVVQHALDLIREAEQIYDREMLHGTAESGPVLRDALRQVQMMVRRAKQIVSERPGTAETLAGQALLQLDRLDAARADIWEL